MKCPRCKRENPAQASFCMACGAGLSARANGGKLAGVPGSRRKRPKSEGAQVPDVEKRLAEALQREAEALKREAEAQEQLQTRLREVVEAQEQQAATSEILKVISSSPTDVKSGFDSIVRSAARLCDAIDGTIFRADADKLVLVAHEGPIRSLPVGPFSALTAGRPSARAVLEARTIHVVDLQAEVDEYPEGSALARSYGFRTILCVPLIRAAAAIGVIAIRRTEARPFTEQQIALLKTFADQAVIAIENVRLFNETKEALEQQTATAEILRVISQSPTDFRPVFEAIAQSVARLTNAVFGATFTVAGDMLHLVGTHVPSGEPHDAFTRAYPIPLDDQTVATRVARDGIVLNIADTTVEPSLPKSQAERLQTFGVRSVLMVPMVRNAQTLGIILAARRLPSAFTETQVKLLQTFADQAVIAVENVRLFKELEARNRDLTESLEQQTATSEILQVISSSPADVQPVLEIVAQNAARVCGASDAIIRRIEGNTMLPAAHFGSIPMSSASVARPITRASIAGRAILERRTIHLYNLPDLEFVREYPDGAVVQQREGYRTIVVTPLLREGAAIGMIAIRRMDARPFTDKQIALLKTFADQAVIAIENVRLFKELQQRTKELESKSRQLEIASQHKSDFLANMSHELRTPLNAIIGFSEVLSERMFGDLNEKQDEYLKDIHASGQHLLSLINDILDLSKIEAGRMELEVTKFDLPMTIDNALTLVRERAARRSIALHTTVNEQLGQIEGDERKIRQVLLNLLSNAIKFTPEGGRIDVEAKPVNGSIEVSVTDTGVGIAPEDQEAVFEEFKQVGTADKKVEGTGLGLALSRKFVELHGGKIWVKSQVGAGSTFTFTLPVHRGE
jgi:signal transduction histidine kinase